VSRALTEWVDGLPRAGFLHAPTPIEVPKQLAQALGVQVLVKREDLSGGAFGGNKVRKLEYLAVTERAQAADVWMATGGVQSNWVRETAAAAARCGKQAIGFLRGPRDSNPARGNVLVDELLGAELRYVDAQDYASVDALMARECAALAARGRCGYPFALGGAEPEAVAAWHGAGRELAGQLAASSVVPDAVVLGAGTGSSALGLAFGLAAAGCRATVWAISASWTAASLATEADRLALATAGAAGIGHLEPPRSLRWDDREVGPGYTVATGAGRKAMLRMARAAGLVADLTYTGKALAGLGRLVAEGELRRGSTVVFVHTGGAPELFARAQQPMEEGI
jgi:D-cysteine desulfhydrase